MIKGTDISRGGQNTTEQTKRIFHINQLTMTLENISQKIVLYIPISMFQYELTPKSILKKVKIF